MAGPIRAPAVSSASWKPKALPRSFFSTDPASMAERIGWRRPSRSWRRRRDRPGRCPGRFDSATSQVRRRAPSGDLQGLRLERAAVLFRDEGVGVYRFAVMHRDDDVDIAGPRPLGVESRRLRRMVGMAVVVADDVEAGGVCLALDSDLISRVDLIAIASTLDDDVSRALHLGHSAVAGRADHDAADLMRIALGSMRPNGLHRVAGYFHLPACRGGRPAKRSGWGRGVTVAARIDRSRDSDPPSPEKL